MTKKQFAIDTELHPESKGAVMSDTDIHSCGYYCDRHACIVAQRNELRDKLFEGQAVKTYSGNKPNYTQFDVPEIAFGETKPMAWDVWTVHNHIFFSIGVQTFQINDVLEHEPDVSAKEFSMWLATQLRHALTQLSNTAPLLQPKPVAIKFQIYKPTPPRGGELKSINSPLLPWVYDQDPLSGNIASMWVTPVATLPPQPELEPVAWFFKRPDNTLAIKIVGKPTDSDWEPLYTTPQRKEWFGLTDDEIKNTRHHLVDGAYDYSFKQGAQWAEAKLKEKNSTSEKTIQTSDNNDA